MRAGADTVELAGSWCVSAAGIGAVAALGAVADQISAIRPHPTIARADGVGGAPAPAMYAPWDEGGDATAPQQRILALLAAVCRDLAAETEAERLFAGRGRVLLLLPPTVSVRGGQLDAAAIQHAFAAALPGGDAAAVTVRAAVDCATATVAGELAGIASGATDWLLIGAADSLIDPATIMELLRDGRLRTRGRAGAVPGEACALALLRRPASASGGAAIVVAAVAEEPNHGRADEAATRGLGTSIDTAASRSGVDIKRCDQVFADLRDDAEGELEWWQTARALWPVGIDERYRRAVAQGVMAAPEPLDAIPPLTRIGDVFGDVGVASLFVQLAVSAEWRRCLDGWSRLGVGAPMRCWMVCETAWDDRRGALCLTVA